MKVLEAIPEGYLTAKMAQRECGRMISSDTIQQYADRYLPAGSHSRYVAVAADKSKLSRVLPKGAYAGAMNIAGQKSNSAFWKRECKKAADRIIGKKTDIRELVTFDRDAQYDATGLAYATAGILHHKLAQRLFFNTVKMKGYEVLQEVKDAIKKNSLDQDTWWAYIIAYYAMTKELPEERFPESLKYRLKSEMQALDRTHEFVPLKEALNEISGTYSESKSWFRSALACMLQKGHRVRNSMTRPAYSGIIVHKPSFMEHFRGVSNREELNKICNPLFRKTLEEML
jgi:hypothetical protein